MAGLADESIRERIARVEERILKAAEHAGRDRRSVTLVAVSKRFPAPRIREAYEAGLRDFGENYVQEFAAKRPELEELEGARFHLIGHLQSNKAALAAQVFDSVQTLDSGKLARKLDRPEHPLDVMIEVRLSGEASKSGAEPDELPRLIDEVRACGGLRLRGLMTMPPWSENPEDARPYFSRLRRLAEQHGLSGLSMGMSHDFEVAIEEGATEIRVGTAIFGVRPPR